MMPKSGHRFSERIMPIEHAERDPGPSEKSAKHNIEIRAARLLPLGPGSARRLRRRLSGHEVRYFAITGARSAWGKNFSIFGSTPFLAISLSQIWWMRES